MKREGAQPEALVWHLDEETLSYGTMLTLRGWAVHRQGQHVTLSCRDKRGRQVPGQETRLRRRDVEQALDIQPLYPEETGFCLLLDTRRVTGHRLVFSLQAGEERADYGIDLKTLKSGREDGKQGDYEVWLGSHSRSEEELSRLRTGGEASDPLISVVVPLYETPRPYLRELLRSMRDQVYGKWELCLADGSRDSSLSGFIRRRALLNRRIRYEKLPENLGIAGNTNAAIRMARGEFILFADHDDTLAPDALFEVAAAARQGAEVIYTDEDKVSMDGRHLFAPNMKTDYDIYRLRENNYICHIFAVRRAILEKVGYLRDEFDGAQDYDLILRCCEAAGHIAHVSRPLYHWRSHMISTAADPDSKAYAFEAGRRAVQAHYDRLGLEAKVEMGRAPGWYRSRIAIREKPLVSILIPTRDHLEDLRVCVDSILECNTWPFLELLILDNESREPETLRWLKDLPEYVKKRCPEASVTVRVLPCRMPFHFSAINNLGAAEAAGDYLLFLNNDTRVLTRGWVQELLMLCQDPEVGAVGAKLYYPDGTIQHAGIVLGLGGVAGHLYCQGAGDDPGYMGRLISVCQVSAVTAACMMVKREDFQSVGGFDESLGVAYNDVDLCLKLRERGKAVLFTPHAELVHAESKSRGAEDTPEKRERLLAETERFREKWAALLSEGDPCYSPNLSLTEGDCRLRE